MDGEDFQHDRQEILDDSRKTRPKSKGRAPSQQFRKSVILLQTDETDAPQSQSSEDEHNETEENPVKQNGENIDEDTTVIISKKSYLMATPFVAPTQSKPLDWLENLKMKRRSKNLENVDVNVQKEPELAKTNAPQWLLELQKKNRRKTIGVELEISQEGTHRSQNTILVVDNRQTKPPTKQVSLDELTSSKLVVPPTLKQIQSEITQSFESEEEFVLENKDTSRSLVYMKINSSVKTENSPPIILNENIDIIPEKTEEVIEFSQSPNNSINIIFTDIEVKKENEIEDRNKTEESNIPTVKLADENSDEDSDKETESDKTDDQQEHICEIIPSDYIEEIISQSIKCDGETKVQQLQLDETVSSSDNSIQNIREEIFKEFKIIEQKLDCGTMEIYKKLETLHNSVEKLQDVLERLEKKFTS